MGGAPVTVTTQYSYEPYGNTTASGAASDNAVQYTGRENDQTGLYFYRARYYDPLRQRFVSEDPIGLAGGVNLYAYVNGNPISYTDPLGLMGNGVGGLSKGYWGKGGPSKQNCQCQPAPPSSPPNPGNILGESMLGTAELFGLAGGAAGLSYGAAHAAALGPLGGVLVADAVWGVFMAGAIVGGAVGVAVGGAFYWWTVRFWSL